VIIKALSWVSREATQLAAAGAGAISLLSLLFGFTPDQQGALNAAIVFIIGALTAWAVEGEKAAPFVAGVVQAMLAVAVAFGAHLSANIQASVVAFVAALVAVWLRAIVTAPK
jgi:nicotinamide riboside transporter PnuC